MNDDISVKVVIGDIIVAAVSITIIDIILRNLVHGMFWLTLNIIN